MSKIKETQNEVNLINEGLKALEIINGLKSRFLLIDCGLFIYLFIFAEQVGAKFHGKCQSYFFSFVNSKYSVNEQKNKIITKNFSGIYKLHKLLL